MALSLSLSLLAVKLVLNDKTWNSHFFQFSVENGKRMGQVALGLQKSPFLYILADLYQKFPG